MFANIRTKQYIQKKSLFFFDIGGIKQSLKILYNFLCPLNLFVYLRTISFYSNSNTQTLVKLEVMYLTEREGC